ncbi:MAG: hypothetical protein WBW32_18765 [Luteibacter sp.]
MVIFVGLLLAAARWGAGGKGMADALIVAVSALVIAFAVHEGGNYRAARGFGMTVLLVQFGALELMPLRKGWKIRWATPVHGGRFSWIYPVADPNRAMRGPCIAVSLGGSLATLTLSSLVGLGVAFAPNPSLRALLVTALCASLTPLVYLFPSSKASEGGAISAWRWWRHPPDPRHLQATRLHGRLVWGSPVSSFSEQELEALGGDIPMSRLWYAVKASQQRGNWSEVARLQEEWNAAIPTTSRMRAVLAELTASTAAELKWMDAVQNRDAALIPDEASIRAAGWGDPALEPRCRATRAWLAGDSIAVSEATDETLRVAKNSQDRSLVESERLILKALAATPR